MTTVSTLEIGPITCRPYNFAASRSAPSGTKGFRGVTFSGMLEGSLADQLDELVANPAARQTIGGVSGVLEYVTPGSSLLVAYTGYYLLERFESAPDGIDPDWPYVGFTLNATFLGDLA